MHPLILTALAVFFLWHAGLRSLARLAEGYFPEEAVNLLQYVVVGLCAWAVHRIDAPELTFVLATGGVVALVNTGVLLAQAQAERAAAPVTIRRGGYR